MMRFQPMAMPFPVPRCALGKTSGVYPYRVAVWCQFDCLSSGLRLNGIP